MIRSKKPKEKLEKEIQKEILTLLQSNDIKCWRNNSGVIFGKNAAGKSYMHRLGPAGSCDIIGLLNDGRFLGIEVKRPGHILSDLQIIFIDEINLRKGIAFMATSTEEVFEKLKSYGITVKWG
jgi:hypothetical protein